MASIAQTVSRIGTLVLRTLRSLGTRSATQHTLAHITALAAEQWRQKGPVKLPDDGILISFVTPTYNTPSEYLDNLLSSFQQQLRTGVSCELILSDDGSTHEETRTWLKDVVGRNNISVVWNSSNRGIAAATNAGIAAASGKWVAFLDHDDRLTEFAADRIARALVENPECELLYTDEVITDASLKAIDIFFKPAWDPVLLSGVNYINHLSVYRRERVEKMGGVREGFEGSQDYDLLLRFTQDLSAHQVKHLPYPAYQWRRTGQTFSATQMAPAIDSARRALSERFSSTSGNVPVANAKTPDLHRVRFDQTKQNWPVVSVIIPTKDRYDLISQVLSGLQKTDYPHLDVICVDNGTTDEKVLQLYRSREESGELRALRTQETFNFSRSINLGLAAARGEFILLLNNDIEVVEPDWLKEMVSCFSYSQVGIVGAKLLYPDSSIQHAGVMVGFGDLAGHWYIGEKLDFPGPQGRLRVRNSFSAVTGACLLMSRKCLEAVGNLNEYDFAIAYNDVDFCLRARKLGFSVIWTPFATLLHHESASRGSDETPENRERFDFEKQNLKKRHSTQTYLDPASSPWLSRDRSYPVTLHLTALPGAR